VQVRGTSSEGPLTAFRVRFRWARQRRIRNPDFAAAGLGPG
jgi:hypothetical protein